MRKNLKYAIVAAMAVAISALSFPLVKFTSWNDTIHYSNFIFLGISKGVPWRTKITNNAIEFNPSRGGLLSEIEVIDVLKGGNSPKGTTINLHSVVWPVQGDAYLIFGTMMDASNCQAFDDYRLINLGHNYPSNLVQGMALEEQINKLLDMRYKRLTNEMRLNNIESNRLADFLKK